jgi:hypothetical protein
MGGDAAGLIMALLGPVEIGPAGGAQAPVPQPRLRVLLGLLGVAAGRMITSESLVAGVWGGGLVAGARELFARALGLWRGAALADAAPLSSRLAGEAARLEEARLAVLEERIAADLALGRHGEVAGELAALAAEFPLRERLTVLLMTALYRSGLRGEALTVYDTARQVLAEQLGLDPGPELAGLQAGAGPITS